MTSLHVLKDISPDLGTVSEHIDRYIVKGKGDVFFVQLDYESQSAYEDPETVTIDNEDFVVARKLGVKKTKTGRITAYMIRGVVQVPGGISEKEDAEDHTLKVVKDKNGRVTDFEVLLATDDLALINGSYDGQTGETA